MVEKLRKRGHGKYGLPFIFLMLGLLIAGILSFFSMRPEMFFLSNIMLIFAIIAILTNNKFINSFVFAGLFMFFVVVVIDVISGNYALIVFHSIIMTLITITIIKNWKNASPVFIIFTSIFYAVYIQAYIIGVKPEFGSEDPFHRYYNIWIGIGIALTGFLMALIINKKTDKWY